MPSVFLIADSHFGHRAICKFTRDDGSKLRPWDNPDEMDRDMVEYWNDTVKPNDKVYHLGDVAIRRKSLDILDQLHGDKVLIKGNHDIFKLQDYVKYFRDIRAYHVMNNYVLSHVPVHPESKGKFSGNLHGHLHYRSLSDPWYQCICVERTNYRPILFERALDLFPKDMV